MKKGFYIRNGSKTQFSGVERKVRDQIKALSACCDDVDEIIVEKEETNLFRSIGWRLPGGSMGMQYEKALHEIETALHAGDEVLFFYIRSSLADRRYVHFLKQLRMKYPGAKILFEIPTYPYGKEVLKNSTMWPWFFKDRIYRGKIHRYIDRIATYSDDDVIFGVPTLKVMNGIDVNFVKPAYRAETTDGRITLIVVAMMQPYHGYERLIEGLAEYYKNGGMRDVYIDMVGYGSELEMYQQLVRDHKLESRVRFKGKLDGAELDDSYTGGDLAVGSLGGYKIGIRKFSSIKLGEYLAKGLPVITGAPTSVFEQYGSRYNLDFPNDPSPIDFSKVITFYDGIYSGRTINEVRDEIRSFAENSIDMRVAFRAVTEYITAYGD